MRVGEEGKGCHERLAEPVPVKFILALEEEQGQCSGRSRRGLPVFQPR